MRQKRTIAPQAPVHKYTDRPLARRPFPGWPTTRSPIDNRTRTRRSERSWGCVLFTPIGYRNRCSARGSRSQNAWVSDDLDQRLADARQRVREVGSNLSKDTTAALRAARPPGPRRLREDVVQRPWRLT